MEIVEKKEIIHESHNDRYAKKGVAGTALGIGIGALALNLLNGGGLFGLGGAQNGRVGQESPSAFNAWERACATEVADQKALYDFALLSADARYNDRSRIDAEFFSLYKTQIDADFNLYKNQRDSYDVLAQRIGNLETAQAVTAAIEPWRSKVTKMEIDNVVDLVALEAERRNCADNKIVTYSNSTFYPKYYTNCELDSTSTVAPTYNPLCQCPNLV